MSHRIATSTATRAASLARGRASQSSCSAAVFHHRSVGGAISGSSSASITNTNPSSTSLDSSRCYSTTYMQQRCSIVSRLPASSALQILPSNSRFGVPSTTSVSSTRRAAISSTPLLLDKDEAAAAADPAAAAATEEDDEDACPPWQNPLHHNNPEFQKVFDEDFEPGEEMPVVPLPPFAAEEGTTVLATPHLHELADEIVRLNLLEVKELIDRMGDHFGFDDEVDMSGMGGGGGDGGGAAAVEEVVEKVIFDLKLTGFDAKSKIKVIKEIRGVTTLGLKEAKELVEGAPTTVKKDIKMEEAEELKAKLEAVGATIEIV